MNTRKLLRDVAVELGCVQTENDNYRARLLSRAGTLRALADRLDAEMANAAKPGGRDLAEYAFLRGYRTALQRLDAPIGEPKP